MARNRSGVAWRYVVEYVDGAEVEVKTRAADVMRWELNHDGEAWAGTGMPAAVRMMEVAFYALKREKLTDAPKFDVWMPTVADFLLIDDEDEGDDADRPTSPDQSDD